MDIGVQRGVRVCGRVQPALLRDLSEDISSGAKALDERGWFCDDVFTLEKILSTFVRYGWRPVNIYESSMVAPGKVRRHARRRGP